MLSYEPFPSGKTLMESWMALGPSILMAGHSFILLKISNASSERSVPLVLIIAQRNFLWSFISCSPIYSLMKSK